MQPWERRLRDLAQTLKNCNDAYFSPDRFRQNTNHFLQTSRTVTFIIQKNKSDIPEFERWYKDNILTPWKSDQIMSWAKDSRNVIEKEGDLEMQSTLRASMLYSYDSSEDVVIETSKRELLHADIDRLIRFAKTALPRGIADAAIIKVERRWVANTLPNNELLYALTYAYARLREACASLALHLHKTLESTIPHPTILDPTTNDAAKARFVKLSKTGVGRNKGIRIPANLKFEPPAALVALKAEFDTWPEPKSLADIVARHVKLAKLTFEIHGNHVPMLALYDRNWKQIDFVTTAFADQSEKFIFWRNIAERATYLKAFALVWTCESWIRDIAEHEERPVSRLPIIGEQLHIIGADATDTHEVVAWNITRSTTENHPILELLKPDSSHQMPDQIFFIKPVVDAMQSVHGRGAG